MEKEIARIEQDIALIGQEITQLRYMDNRLHNLDTWTIDYTTQIHGQAISQLDRYMDKRLHGQNKILH